MQPLFIPERLRFHNENDEHRYTYDGAPFVGVTNVLMRAGFLDSRWWTEGGRTRGTFVHKATELIDKGRLNWKKLDPRLEGYARAYQRFLEEKGFTALYSEMSVAHPIFRYAGTLDRLGTMGTEMGCEALVDLKSGAEQKTTGLQTAAYAGCFEKGDTFLRFGLYLGKDGKYKLVPYKDKKDFRVFLAATSCAQWQIAHNVKEKEIPHGDGNSE